MAANHTWSITNLKQLNDGTGTVSSVSYSIETVDSDDETINIQSSGEIVLNTDNISNFIPYEQLTEFEIIQWVRSYFLDYTNLELQHTAFVEEQKILKSPDRVITNVLPWNG